MNMPLPPHYHDVPPLENGDRLSRVEFERRYHAMPELKKAELIEGVVHMPSPVRFPQHGHPHAWLLGWLTWYEASTPGVAAADNATARLDPANEPQPDAVLLINPTHGGQTRLSPEGYIEGGPELAAEVASSSVSIDLHDKFQVYQRNGVREYVVWRVLESAVDWFVLREGVFERLAPDADGCYRSVVFPGLWLDAAALVRGDLATVLRVLQQGLASAEHAAFAARLGAAGPR